MLKERAEGDCTMAVSSNSWRNSSFFFLVSASMCSLKSLSFSSRSSNEEDSQRWSFLKERRVSDQEASDDLTWHLEGPEFMKQFQTAACVWNTAHRGIGMGNERLTAIMFNIVSLTFSKCPVSYTVNIYVILFVNIHSQIKFICSFFHFLIRVIPEKQFSVCSHPANLSHAKGLKIIYTQCEKLSLTDLIHESFDNQLMNYVIM